MWNQAVEANLPVPSRDLRRLTMRGVFSTPCSAHLRMSLQPQLRFVGDSCALCPSLQLRSDPHKAPTQQAPAHEPTLVSTTKGPST